MEQTKRGFYQKLKVYLATPIISKKVDPFIVIFYSFLGAFIGMAFPEQTPLWKVLFTVLPITLISIALLSLIGARWRKKNSVEE